MKTPKPPPPERACRLRPSQRLKHAVLAAQGHACLGCGEGLVDVEFDHVTPLGLGGSNALENWAALCPRCHKEKTVQDLRRIAKAKRQRRYHETGRSRAPREGLPGYGGKQGFDRTWRRHMNGDVTRRCFCPQCRGAS